MGLIHAVRLAMEAERITMASSPAELPDTTADSVSKMLNVCLSALELGMSDPSHEVAVKVAMAVGQYHPERRPVEGLRDPEPAGRCSAGGPAVMTAQVGQKIKLLHCDDPFTRLRPGDTGVLTGVDDAGTVFVSWDDGHDLGLIEGLDLWVTLMDAEAAVDGVEDTRSLGQRLGFQPIEGGTHGYNGQQHR